MKPKTYKTEGIVLSRINYSEADRILKIYTKYYGRVTVIAKGVRRPKSKKRGALEVFSRIKFFAARGKNLDIITEVDMIDSFKPVRESLNKVSVAYFLMEVINRLTKEDEENEELYGLLLSYLEKLKKEKKLKKIRNDFTKDALTLLGYWPEGKELKDPDLLLEEVAERQMTSARVGKEVLK